MTIKEHWGVGQLMWWGDWARKSCVRRLCVSHLVSLRSSSSRLLEPPDQPKTKSTFFIPPHKEQEPNLCRQDALSWAYLSLFSASSQPYPSLIPALSQPYLSLMPALSQPYPRLISALSQPYPSIISASIPRANGWWQCCELTNKAPVILMGSWADPVIPFTHAQYSSMGRDQGVTCVCTEICLPYVAPCRRCLRKICCYLQVCVSILMLCIPTGRNLKVSIFSMSKWEGVYH